MLKNIARYCTSTKHECSRLYLTPISNANQFLNCTSFCSRLFLTARVCSSSFNLSPFCFLHQENRRTSWFLTSKRFKDQFNSIVCARVCTSRLFRMPINFSIVPHFSLYCSSLLVCVPHRLICPLFVFSIKKIAKPNDILISYIEAVQRPVQ